MPSFRKIPRGAIKIHLPGLQQQTDSSCGAAALQSIAAYFGVGGDDETDFVTDMGYDARVGSHPHHVIRAARRYKLRHFEKCQMTFAELRAFLRTRKPVMMMIQAWGDRSSYAGVWNEGHWVAAIGYDREGVYFQDPSLAGIRGFLGYDELDVRWRDVGPRNRRMRRYGIALWRKGVRPPPYLIRAQRIE